MPYESAPIFRRLAARLLDLAFCLLLTFVVAIPVGILLVPVTLLTTEAYEAVIYGSAAWLCYFIAYVGSEVFLLIRRDGQTLGKGLLGLRVVPAGEWDRPRLELLPAGSRMLIIFLPFVFMSLSGSYPESAILNGIAAFGFLALIVSFFLSAIPAGKRRALHDLATGSRVVRAAKRKIDWKNDIPMVLPGRVDMRKRP
ncbi:RDD family protein [Nocardia gipuzkoensis]|uniref:RDD family protein n=1 Tax=Nocardia gipuzkoensis TaxID=2749991 RepID=UPI001E5EC16C|nr:RDD family protein [Nocardia gipuzkoensis]UGT67653.1 RDD family protein [Nocardia gipuzkoensis]